MTITTEDARRTLFHEGVYPVVDPRAAELETLLEQLTCLTDEQMIGRGDDAARIEQLRLLEQIKAAAAGAQARVTVAFERSQLAQQDAAGVRPEHRGRGIGDQVALARGSSASQGPRHLGFAKALREMPHTNGLLAAGQISEWTATVLVRETACLSVEDRQLADQRLCATTLDANTGELREAAVLAMTAPRVQRAAHALACELDPASVVRRAAKAETDRRVTIRPAPDTMTYVTGLLPVAQGVAAYANLNKSAQTLKSAGDPRTINQIMADLFVERLTGQATADAVPIEVGLIMSPDTLIGASEQPARTTDGTIVPARTARDLVLQGKAPAWLRRVYTDPATAVVTSVDTRRRRFFGDTDSRLLRLRDQTCRHPGCDAPIAHDDHVQPFARGGETTPANGQGLCQGHNQVKELPGWTDRVTDPRPGHHTTEITTPTGHTYRSQAPPGLPPPA
jgi:hypothetical protein